MKKLKVIFLSFLVGCSSNNKKIDYHADHEGYPELEMIHGHERPLDGPPDKK